VHNLGKMLIMVHANQDEVGRKREGEEEWLANRNTREDQDGVKSLLSEAESDFKGGDGDGESPD